MGFKGEFINTDYLSARELRKAEYLRSKIARSSSPQDVAIYERKLKRLFQLASHQNNRVNRKVKIKTPTGTATFKSKNVEDFARGVSEVFSRPNT
ncbi:hypothetical protein D7Z54_24630 [Salibacterium salarium]|uniref:Uncharacterized protein n=1 Tax=Salibacterium salarium TaxID=284579 RepID=A0A3R9RA34_9BACI|nr:hypothetical protein [Salibacterium salarium]RSL30686.1 hypothetical protein D7Z54_24630 [Salibacterium salarium]